MNLYIKSIVAKENAVITPSEVIAEVVRIRVTDNAHINQVNNAHL